METCFADTPRIKDKPFEKRIAGDDLLVRDKYGHVERRFGWFSESQVKARKAWDEQLSKFIREIGKHLERRISTWDNGEVSPELWKFGAADSTSASQTIKNKEVL